MSATKAPKDTFEHRGIKVDLLPSGSWQADLRGHSSKGQSKRPSRKTKPEIKKLIDERLDLQTGYGAAGQEFLKSFSNEELFTTLHEFNEFKKAIPEADLVTIIKAGVASERERLFTEQFPLMADWLEGDYKKHWWANNTSGAEQKKHSWNSVERAFKSFNEATKGWHINQVFHPQNRLRSVLSKYWGKLKLKGGGNGRREKEKRAGHIQKALDRCLIDYPAIHYSNPLKNWKAEFAEDQIQKAAKVPKSYSSKKIQEILYHAASDKKLCEMIPFIVLQVFGGCRPSDIDGLDEHRMWHWANMKGWNQISDVTGGIKFQTPAIDEDQNPMQKKATWVERDLHPTGLEWLRWWCLQFKGMPSLPNEGSYNPKALKPKGEARMNRLRKACGIQKGSKDFIQDGFRKTFATAIHKIRPSSEFDYWLRCCSHSESVHATFYKNPAISDEEANALFSILPPEVEDNQKAEIFAVHEAVASIEKEHGIDRDDFPDWDFSTICFYDLLEIGEIQVEVCKHYPSDYIAPFMDWVEPDEIMDGDAAVDRHKKRIANLSDGDKAMWEVCLEWRKRQAKEIND